MIHPTWGNPRRKTNTVASPPAREANDTPQRRTKFATRFSVRRLNRRAPGAPSKQPTN